MSVAGAIIWLGLVAIMLTHDRPDTPAGRSVAWQLFWRVTCSVVLVLVVKSGTP